MFRSIRLKKVLAVLTAMTLAISSLIFQIPVSADDTITQTTILDPSKFSYAADQMSLTTNGNSFDMTLLDSSPITYPSMSMTVKVDLDKVPYFSVDTASCTANRRIDIVNTATNERLNFDFNEVGHAGEGVAAPGVKEVDITEKTGWSGVVSLQIVVYLMYYNGQGKTNSYNKIFFADTVGTNGIHTPSIDKTTILDPTAFTYASDQMDLIVNGNGFDMVLLDSSPITYPSMSMTVKVDLDEVPYFSVDSLNIAANRRIDIINTANNERLNFDFNEMEHNGEGVAAPGVKEVDITEKTGWSGVVNLKIVVYLMYYNGQGKTNSYNKIFFADTTGTNGVAPIDKVTVLDPKTFSYAADQMSLITNGNSFDMTLLDSSPITYPSMSMTVRVNLDKVPYFSVDTASCTANRRIDIINTANNERLNFDFNEMDHNGEGVAAPGVKEVDITEKTGWSGIVNLKIVVYLMYYNGQGKTNSYNKMFFADTTGTNGVGPIETTTTLNPDNFVVPDALTVDKNGNSFSMRRSDTCDPNYTWPDMKMTYKVDLNKVPYFGINVASAETNYKVVLKNVANGESINVYSDQLAHEQSPANETGLTEINLKERSGWSGVVEIELMVQLIYYNGHGTYNRFVKAYVASEAGTNGGTEDDVPPNSPIDPSVITSTTTLDPNTFVVPDALTVDKNGNSFSMRRSDTCDPNYTWPDMKMTYKVDLNKVPYFGINVASAETNYKVLLTNVANGESINVYSDQLAHEQSPANETGLTEINLKERSGWSGVVEIELRIWLIYYNGHGTYNRFVKAYVASEAGTNGGTEDDVPPNDPNVDPSVITSTTTLNPNNFVVPDALTVDKNGNSFSMRRSDTCDPNYTWPDMKMTYKVNLDKVPYFGINVASAETNYKVVLKNVANGESINVYSDQLAHEQSPANETGLTEINLKERSGWSGVVEIELMVQLIYYNTQGTYNRFVKAYVASEAGTNGGTEDDVPPNDPNVDPSVITSTTTLDPNTFVVPDALDVKINGNCFSMERSDTCPPDFTWPDLKLTYKVDLDKVPYFGVKLASAETNFKLLLKNTANGEIVNVYNTGNVGFEGNPNDGLTGLTEINVKEATGWSGVVEIEMILHLIYYNGQGEKNVFTKLFVASETDTNGGTTDDAPPSDQPIPDDPSVITSTTTFNPNTFVVPEALDVKVNGNCFTMERSDACPPDFTWPDLKLTYKVDLDKVPYFGVKLASAETNFKLLLKNTANGEMVNVYNTGNVGFEGNPNDGLTGLTEINVKEATGWSGVVEIEMTLFLIYYNGQGEKNTFTKLFVASETGTNGGTTDDAPPSDQPIPDDPSVITSTTTFNPNNFVVPNTLDVKVNGNCFTMERSNLCPPEFTWPDLKLTYKVDLDKVPYFGVKLHSAETNFKLILKNTATGEILNVYNKDVVGFEGNPNDGLEGITEINVKEATGWSGVVEIEMWLHLIYYNGQGEKNTFTKLFVASEAGTNGGTTDDAPPSDQQPDEPTPDIPLDPTAIHETTFLDPHELVAGVGKINMDIDAPTFSMTFDQSNEHAYASMTVTKKVDLTRAPIIMVNVLDAKDNYRIDITNLTENKTINFYSGKEDGYERAPSDALGVTRRNLVKDLGFKADIADIQITIYYNKYRGNYTNIFGSIAFETVDNPADTSDQILIPDDYIKEPTVLDPSKFVVDTNALNFTVNGNSFTMQKAPTSPADWPHFEFEVAVDLSKVPYMQVSVPEAEANFSVRMRAKGGEWVNFHSDQFAYECSPKEIGLKETNLVSKLGKQGIVVLQVQIYIIVVGYAQESINTYDFISFTDKSMLEEEGSEDEDNQPEEEDRTDPWEYGVDPWAGGTVKDGMESIEYISGDSQSGATDDAIDDEQTTPETGVGSTATAMSLILMGAAFVAMISLRRKKKIDQ